jgi:hypothetical protein
MSELEDLKRRVAQLETAKPETPTPPFRFKRFYDTALALITQIEDDGYRRVATEALILELVRREKGFHDAGGELAMHLRREAADQ